MSKKKNKNKEKTVDLVETDNIRNKRKKKEELNKGVSKRKPNNKVKNGKVATNNKKTNNKNKTFIYRKQEHWAIALYNNLFGGLDKVTKIYLVIGAVLTIFTLSLFVESLVSAGKDEVYEVYTDTDLNFRMAIPHGWQAAKPEAEEVKKAVKEETDGKEAFDMFEHSLGKEVVPIAIVNADSESKKFAEFATLAFRGSDPKFSYLDDLVNIKDDVADILKASGNKDVKVLSVEETTLGKFSGVLAKAKATYELEEVEYYIWHEPAGANLLTLTYGATGLKEKDILKNLQFIIEGLIYDQPTLGMTPEEELEYLDLVEKQAEQLDAEQFSGHSEDDGHNHTEEELEDLNSGGTTEEESVSTEETKEETTEKEQTNILPTVPTWGKDKEEEKK